MAEGVDHQAGGIASFDPPGPDPRAASASTGGDGAGGPMKDSAPPGGFQILVVEDEEQVRRFLRNALRLNGYRVAEATTGTEALAIAESRRPDLVILDLGLPDVDGMTIVKSLRGWFSGPIVVVSARYEENDKVRALDAGADDYLTKPFGTSELLARLRVALRHDSQMGKEPDQGVFQTGSLRVDLDRHEVSVRGQSVKLTPLEYRLLNALIRHAGKVVTQRQLLREVWGEAHLEEAHYLRVYMSALRRKLEEDPARPKLLLTEQSVGYRLLAD
jgi:two-component system KDP operon response regulator KdpE